MEKGEIKRHILLVLGNQGKFAEKFFRTYNICKWATSMDLDMLIYRSRKSSPAALRVFT